MVDFIDAAAITYAAPGLLLALPKTQLWRRLAQEGRLHADSDIQLDKEPCNPFGAVWGLNFETKRPRRDVLVDYVTVLEQLYSQDKFFERLRREALSVARPRLAGWSLRNFRMREVSATLRILWQMTVARPELRRHFWKTVADCALHNPVALRVALVVAATYVDLGPFCAEVSRQVRRQIALIDLAERTKPRLRSEFKAASGA